MVAVGLSVAFGAAEVVPVGQGAVSTRTAAGLSEWGGQDSLAAVQASQEPSTEREQASKRLTQPLLQRHQRQFSLGVFAAHEAPQTSEMQASSALVQAAQPVRGAWPCPVAMVHPAKVVRSVRKAPAWALSA